MNDMLLHNQKQTLLISKSTTTLLIVNVKCVSRMSKTTKNFPNLYIHLLLTMQCYLLRFLVN